MPELLTGPPAEPLTVADLKDFLRITQDAEDALLGRLITTARQMVESAAARILLTQTWRVVRDAWPPSGLLLLPLAPAATIAAARLRHADGSETALPLNAFTLRGDRTPAVIALDKARLPAPDRRVGGIEFDLVLGYGETSQDVPGDLVQAVRLLAAHLHERREEAGVAGLLPEGVAALLRPYRMVRL
ncbi:head-tail connector protein [Aquabacter cavernae]|uniref:head-tail connector protein n=1 Tax=Aquabacter cavernae TaxID=2496029 RepID=UPI0013DF3520|nr:phage head-tail connector protein [Aquabacter cavernae]